MKKILSIDQRIPLFIEAWEKNASETKFAGMTLQEYKTGTELSLEIRGEIAARATEQRGAIAKRTQADQASRALTNRLVFGVKADPNHGADGAMYRAMKYVPTSEARSGLTHKTTASSPAPTPATT